MIVKKFQPIRAEYLLNTLPVLFKITKRCGQYPSSDNGTIMDVTDAGDIDKDGDLRDDDDGLNLDW